MAGAADKKQAQRNLEVLSSVHKLSIIINIIALIAIFFIKRPLNGKKYYFIWSMPAFFCQYTIEKIGRPTYKENDDGYKVLVRPGDDLQQPGLTEYMFDIVYLTLGIDLLMVLFGSMKVWWILLVIPVFAGWKLRWIASTLLGFVLPRRNKTATSGPTDSTATPAKSKRQQKLEKRGEKIRYR